MLDGAARVRDLVAAVAADGQPAVAITDHGVLYGVVDFYKAATGAGIKPIIGIEAYVTPGSRFDRLPRRQDVRHHMTLLAASEEGYRNLITLSSRAFLEGFYYKPRMDREVLAAHSEGIVATSGCLGGPVAQLLAPDASTEEGNATQVSDYRAAVETAAMYQDIFGRENFYIEVQDHGIPAQRKLTPDLLKLAKEIGAPLLATNDSHYTYAAEADSHDVLLCIQTGANRSDPGRLRFDSAEFYVKSAAQMRALFPEDQYPGACDNTLAVAERTETKLQFGRILLPQFPVPAGATEASHLLHLVMEGARQRYGDPLPEVVTARIDYELGVIAEMGFSAYFLIVWDLIRYANERRIRTGPGRGSAAGSIVAYSLGITKLDPIEFGLIFERFLNPGRRQMPDIDMDFDERYRAEVIRYCAERYGSDHVAQIVTFSTIKGRQALRDSARVLGYPYSLGDRVAKLMPPPILGVEASLKECLETPETADSVEVKGRYRDASGLRHAYDTDPEAREVIDTARGLEGLRRQDSIHAAAVVISPVPLTEIVPIQRKGEDAEIVTQYEFSGVEALGLLKMDFLGLRNLATIERALELIERTTGERVDVDAVPLDDPAVYAMLQDGASMGVFQFEGGPMRALMRNLRPERFEHLVALNALYRPGPLGANMHNEYADRKNGRRPVELPHPDLAEILGDTFGIMVYQEQVMQVAQRMAGFSMADADDLRKAMGKKIPAVMHQQLDRFIAGCLANGYDQRLATDLFGFIEHFAGYGFNRSHSAAYAYVAYQTAWLKAHHPAEYMAALLTATKRDKERTAVYLNECRTMGLRVLVPDVNRSDADFAAVAGEITFGLSAIRNVGEAVVDHILTERDKNGKYQSFQDFVDRVDVSVLNRRVIDALIKAGAFDSLGHPRRGLLELSMELVEHTLERRRAEDMGQYSLFGGSQAVVPEEPVPVPELRWERRIQLGFEKEMLGLYVSDHPLFGVERILGTMCTSTIPALWELADKAEATVGGIVGTVTRRYTKKGEPMLFFTLEDLEGSTEVIAFPATVEKTGPLVREDAVVVVSGRVDHRGDDVKFVARDIKEPRLEPEDTVRLRVAAVALSRTVVDQLKEVLAHHPGRATVYLHMHSEAGEKVMRLGDDHRVEPRSSLFADLRGLLGSGAVL
ncbi:MAG: DNA polymerase III subunit alpha [Acidimicrobiia bacterium]|nr:DNA polymerase III subunit alpha [Acidimicrobiia bacterium]